ncbi:hypothetical protein [Helcococcus kunzii]|uniref:hypothetical protein n=1 Tax=Helcococcus kunzii TaxID=40091 RepID=UPI0024ADBD72|nr:hypothetical protein [Helcococcus kunzii]
MLKLLIKKSLLSKKFIFASCLILFMCFLANFMHMPDDIFNKSLIEAILIPLTGYQSMLSLIAPVIVCVPFAAEYVNYNRGGFEKYAITRTGKDSWYNHIFIINMIIGFLVFVITLIIYCIICFLFFRGKIDQSNLTNLFDGVYKGLASKSYVLFAIVNIIHTGLYGVAFASMGLALSFYFKNKFIAWIGPFILSNLLGLTMIKFNLTAYAPNIMFKTSTIGHQTFINILISFTFITVGSYFAGKLKFKWNVKNDQEF